MSVRASTVANRSSTSLYWIQIIKGDTKDLVFVPTVRRMRRYLVVRCLLPLNDRSAGFGLSLFTFAHPLERFLPQISTYDRNEKGWRRRLLVEGGIPAFSSLDYLLLFRASLLLSFVCARRLLITHRMLVFSTDTPYSSPSLTTSPIYTFTPDLTTKLIEIPTVGRVSSQPHRMLSTRASNLLFSALSQSTTTTYHTL
jgi:hypothetical protein